MKRFMKPAGLLPILLLATLSGCGEPVSDNHFANSSLESTAAQPAPEADPNAPSPVRVGEYGLNFAACPWVGTTRHVEPEAGLAVRTSPFDTSAESGKVAADGRFYVCTRSIDQKWFGIVYDESGALGPRCGVSDPVPSKRAYDGPCRSGWVTSAFVKLIAGDDQPAPAPNPPLAGPAPASKGP
ncbi:MAG TPA: hypothetical protein VK472_00310 [Allosphingosinicella sp.]|nr:hypothetical protein [Allosphingosinicella sp.]